MRLCVKDDEGKVIAVVQLVNKRRRGAGGLAGLWSRTRQRGFDASDEKLIHMAGRRGGRGEGGGAGAV